MYNMKYMYYIKYLIAYSCPERQYRVAGIVSWIEYMKLWCVYAETEKMCVHQKAWIL